MGAFLKHKTKNYMPKQTPLEKIDAIMSKLSIPEQLDLWRDEGDKIHQRIEEKKKEKQEEIENLSDYQNQLPKK